MRGIGIAAIALAAVWAAACGVSVVGADADADRSDAGTPSETGTSSGVSSSSSSSSSGGVDGGAELDGAACGADLTSNAIHCGRCNHDCLGGSCIKGECQPTVFASGESGARGVAVIGGDLWWTRESAGQVRKEPLAGGSVTTMITKVTNPTDVAGLGAHVFVVDRNAGKVSRWETTGVDVETWTISSEPTPTGVSADGTNVYWTTQEQDGVGTVGVNGAPLPTLRLPAQNYPSDVVVIGPTMYFASGSGILSSPVATGQPQAIVSPTSRFKDGGGDLIHTGLAVDGSTIFFTIGALNLVAAVSTSGGVARLLAGGQSDPEGIAVTPTAIYWANAGAGTIMKLAR